MIKHYKTRVPTTAHYYVYGDFNARTRFTWLALHGYGQLSRSLLGKFNALDPEEHVVVAPEGLSHFYWKGVRGDVVASWMTSKDRLDEIADYVGYLDHITETIGFGEKGSAKKILFGFSQGCATGWRWLINSRPPIDAYVIWSGWLPEDMDYDQHADYLSGIKLIYVHGEQDVYYQNDRFSLLLRRFENAGLHPRVITHAGGHSIDRSVLTGLIREEL